MPGTYCIVISEDNVGVGLKMLELQKAGCTNINVVESKTYMFDEHRRADPARSAPTLHEYFLKHSMPHDKRLSIVRGLALSVLSRTEAEARLDARV